MFALEAPVSRVPPMIGDVRTHHITYAAGCGGGMHDLVSQCADEYIQGVVYCIVDCKDGRVFGTRYGSQAELDVRQEQDVGSSSHPIVRKYVTKLFSNIPHTLQNRVPSLR